MSLPQHLERRGLTRWPQRLRRLVGGVLLTLISATAAPAPAPAAASAPPRVLLLGEIHDNAAGHRGRLAWLQAQSAAGTLRPTLVLEPFDREQQATLAAARAACRTADCLIDRLGRSAGWDWPLLAPLLQLALDEGWPLVAANVSRADAARAMQAGVAAVFDAATARAYRLEQPPPADIATAHREDIVASHCGMLGPDDAGPMVNAQVARDVAMAAALAAVVDAGRDAVLIAGNGHVRRDIGVPRWLPPTLAARAEVQAWTEADEVPPPGRYDVVHRVPAAEREDPCIAFRQSMQRRRPHRTPSVPSVPAAPAIPAP